MDPTFMLAAVIGFALLMYVLLDGFDLGIGILFLMNTRPEDRHTMMSSITPFWDGNETWLVLGGAGLFGAFPLAYATLLPALYVPVMVMLFALVFRGVAFEYRFKSGRPRYWDLSFSLGSIIAAVAQGIMIGAVISGIPIIDRRFAGGSFDWLTPFNIMCGFGAAVGYALLGATWLIMKTEGRLHEWSRWRARQLVPFAAAFILLVTVWTPYAHAYVAERWFSRPNIFLLSPLPAMSLLLGVLFWRELNKGSEIAPFACVVGLLLLLGAGLAVSLYPYVVPFDVTLWDAAPQRESQMFLLIGVAVLLPIILAYTGYNYWTFRGKVSAGQSYE